MHISNYLTLIVIMISIFHLNQCPLGIGNHSRLLTILFRPVGLHAPKDYQFTTKERQTKQSLE